MSPSRRPSRTYSKGPKGIRVVRVITWLAERSAVTALIGRLAAAAGSDEQTAGQRLMDSLSGIPIGRPVKLDHLHVPWRALGLYR
jgi:hypothetical protein